MHRYIFPDNGARDDMKYIFMYVYVYTYLCINIYTHVLYTYLCIIIYTYVQMRSDDGATENGLLGGYVQ